jgi:hypothetical protein
MSHSPEECALKFCALTPSFVSVSRAFAGRPAGRPFCDRPEHGTRIAVAARRLAAPALAAFALFVMPAPAAASPTLVVHVSDYAMVPAGELQEAQRVVSDVYAEAGVRVLWRGGSAALASSDQALHLDAVILSRPMIAKAREPNGVLGRGEGVSRRAYIFYARVVDYAVIHQTITARVLAHVLAHEIGHVVLPPGHSAGGLMQASLHGQALILPSFTPAQAKALQSRLAPGALRATRAGGPPSNPTTADTALNAPEAPTGGPEEPSHSTTPVGPTALPAGGHPVGE